MPRLLGIDYGTRRIGIAISDKEARLAVGFATWVYQGKQTIRQLGKLVEDENIHRVVVGYPLTLRGEVGPKAREVDRFIDQLEVAGISVERWDERLTTRAASQSARQAGLSDKKQRGRLDMAAAILMLQNYLDAHL